LEIAFINRRLALSELLQNLIRSLMNIFLVILAAFFRLLKELPFDF